MRLKPVFIMIAALLIACSGDDLTAQVSAQTAEASKADETLESTPQAQILKRDFERMMRLFPGRYDNQEQVYFQDRLELPKDIHLERTHHIYSPVQIDGFDGRLFHVKQYRNDNPEDVYRQRIYQFQPDFAKNAIRLKIFSPKQTSLFSNESPRKPKFDALKPADFETTAGCELYWRAELESFRGSTEPGACQVTTHATDKNVTITYDMQLSASGIWIKNAARHDDGTYFYGNPAGIPSKNLRARTFKCWVSPKKADGDYGFYNNLTLHDQGGRIWIEGEDHQRMGLKMRNVVWPTGRNRNSLVLYAYRGDDEERAVSYAWTSPDADRIAINLRWIQASCTLDND